MIYMFETEYQDTKYKILSEYSKDEMYVGIKPNIIKIYSTYIYNTINDALRDGKTVFIPKLCVNSIDYSDIIINDGTYNELDIEKMVAKKRAQDLILLLRVNKDVFIYLYKTLLAKNVFSNITDIVMNTDNKEDIFLDIISKASEMEDESKGEYLIKILEDFLNTNDKVNTILKFIYDQGLYSFDKYIDNIKVVPDTNQMLNEYEYPTIQDAIDAVKSKYADFVNIWGV